MVVGACTVYSSTWIPLMRQRASSPSCYRCFSTTTRFARQGRQRGGNLHHSIFSTWSLRVTCQFRKEHEWRQASFRAATTGTATDVTRAGTRVVQGSDCVLIKNPPVPKQQTLKGNNAPSADPVNEDPALVWARANPRVAQACLHVPPMPTTLFEDDRNGLTASGFRDWLHYLQRRQWNDIFASLLSIESNKDNDAMALHHARALVSHVLTGPLTLYTALVSSSKIMHLFSRTTTKNSNNNDTVSCITTTKTTDTTTRTTAATATTLRLCCIGARSEAMLPVEYWKELLDLLVLYRRQQQQHGASSSSASSSAALNLYIDFCGPEMNSQRPDTTLSSSLEDDSLTSSSSHVTLRWVYTGKFHDYYHQNNDGFCLPDYDVMVLFNPGVGHPYLQKDWKPTLDLLFPSSANLISNEEFSSIHGTASHNSKKSTQSPTAQPCTSSTVPSQRQPPLVILTAHSAEDAARDQAHLRRHYGSVRACAGLEYVVNPFSSHIRYQDPLQANHMVQPNYCVAVV